MSTPGNSADESQPDIYGLDTGIGSLLMARAMVMTGPDTWTVFYLAADQESTARFKSHARQIQQNRTSQGRISKSRTILRDAVWVRETTYVLVPSKDGSLETTTNESALLDENSESVFTSKAIFTFNYCSSWAGSALGNIAYIPQIEDIQIYHSTWVARLRIATLSEDGHAGVLSEDAGFGRQRNVQLRPGDSSPCPPSFIQGLEPSVPCTVLGSALAQNTRDNEWTRYFLCRKVGTAYEAEWLEEVTLAQEVRFCLEMFHRTLPSRVQWSARSKKRATDSIFARFLKHDMIPTEDVETMYINMLVDAFILPKQPKERRMFDQALVHKAMGRTGTPPVLVFPSDSGSSSEDEDDEDDAELADDQVGGDKSQGRDDDDDDDENKDDDDQESSSSEGHAAKRRRTQPTES